MDEDGIVKLLDKSVVVYFDDGERISRKSGKLVSAGSDFLLLQTSTGQEAIGTKNIIRVSLEVRL